MRIERLGMTIIIVVGAVMLVGCLGSSKTPPTRYYTLNSPFKTDTQTSAAAHQEDPAIAVGPVRVPRYLNRQEILTRSGRNEFQIAELHKWAEPLEENLARVIAENLSSLVPTDRITRFPWKRSVEVEFQVTLEVVQFDTDIKGNSTLIVRWQILKRDGKTVLMSKKSHYSAKVSGEGYDARVATMNQTVEDLSREIAEAIRNSAQSTAKQ